MLVFYLLIPNNVQDDKTENLKINIIDDDYDNQYQRCLSPYCYSDWRTPLIWNNTGRLPYWYPYYYPYYYYSYPYYPY